MKNAAWLSFFAASLVLGTTSYSSAQQPAAKQAAAQQAAIPPAALALLPDRSRHVAVVVQGDVTFKRAGWKEHAPLRFGTVLRLGDLLTLSADASATVVCDGFATAKIVGGPGTKPVPCPRGKSPNHIWDTYRYLPSARIEVPVSNLTASAGATTFDIEPELIWPAVPSADGYVISLKGPGTAWQSTIKGCSTETEAAVCSAAFESLHNRPKLQLNAMYMLAITPKSDDGKASGLSFARAFTVLDRPADIVVQSILSSLKNLGVGPLIVSFLSGRMLASVGSHDDAISMFNALRPQLSEPALDAELAGVYREKGSDSVAEKLLESAIEAYTKNGDVVGRALAEESLGDIQIKASRLVSGLAHLQNARAIYEKLGDATEVKRLDESLLMLKKIDLIRTQVR